MKRSAGDYDGEETIMTYAVTGEGERTDHHPSAGPGSASPTKKKSITSALSAAVFVATNNLLFPR